MMINREKRFHVWNVHSTMKTKPFRNIFQQPPGNLEVVKSIRYLGNHDSCGRGHCQSIIAAINIGLVIFLELLFLLLTKSLSLKVIADYDACQQPRPMAVHMLQTGKCGQCNVIVHEEHSRSILREMVNIRYIGCGV